MNKNENPFLDLTNVQKEFDLGEVFITDRMFMELIMEFDGFKKKVKGILTKSNFRSSNNQKKARNFRFQNRRPFKSEMIAEEDEEEDREESDKVR